MKIDTEFEYYHALAILELMLEQYGKYELLKMIDYVATKEWTNEE